MHNRGYALILAEFTCKTIPPRESLKQQNIFPMHSSVKSVSCCVDCSVPSLTAVATCREVKTQKSDRHQGLFRKLMDLAVVLP